MNIPVRVLCPCCGKENHLYYGKWTLVCSCGHILHLGPSPVRLQFLGRDSIPEEHSFVSSGQPEGEKVMGKSVWINCPCCGEDVKVYQGKWTLACICRQLLYFGSLPVRFQIMGSRNAEESCQPALS
ncbi:MAG: hypothetical protein KOO63_09850 [Bacteroidales bacterium]|nr:hypothetical protein [Candidatus Latescibacterota bacterium]